jgi:hypothetical protein
VSSVARNRRLQILGRSAGIGDDLVPSMAYARDRCYPAKAPPDITQERMCEERIKKIRHTLYTLTVAYSDTSLLKKRIGDTVCRHRGIFVSSNS